MADPFDHDSAGAYTITERATQLFDGWIGSTTVANFIMIVVFIIVVLIGLGIGLATTRPFVPISATSAPTQIATSSPSTAAITAVFTCDGGRSITAVFSGSSVQLSLSDGRSLTLPQAVSADGARYANPDESFVFWNVGNTATITENGTNTYDNCVTNS